MGSGAPGNADMLAALADWVERGSAPGGLQLVEQETKAAVRGEARAAAVRMAQVARQYKGGDVNAASSFECAEVRLIRWP